MTTTARLSSFARLAAMLGLACLPGFAARGEAPAPTPAPEGPSAVSGAPAKTSVTFNRDVAPLVFRRCASCHRPGEVAPFPLLNYVDVSKRAGLIRSVVEGRVMPPWKAEPGFGHFADDRRLTDEQVATVVRWVEAGTPEGDPADLPPLPRFAAGWQLGEPDMVVKMDEPYNLVAEGEDVYRCFVIPLQIPEGKYLKAVEYRPGNRRVVHHAVFSSLDHTSAQAKLAEGDGKSFGSGLRPPGQLLAGPLAFWTPGMTPHPLPEDLAAEWPKQADLVMQLHLHPSGKAETEQSSIGLHFTDRKPSGKMKLMILSNNQIDIPPGDADYAIERSMTLREPVEVHGVFPHMHLIAKTVKVTATLPDGTSEPMISIADWDFQWQHYYEYASPLRLPAGTRLEGRWTYDNSAGNPANPNRPPKRVTYGEQTTNEMAILVLDVISSAPSAKSRAEAGAGASGAEDHARRAADLLRQIDKDGDGKLALDEIMAVDGDREPRAEIERRLVRFDRDGDQLLGAQELAEALRELSRR